ncbi:MAG: aminoglycoside 6-adenylyltransferase [Anaerolineae bacterium]|nr:aminoglycoside 6-adenylyltransferase [Anaerolineae bacterium]
MNAFLEELQQALIEWAAAQETVRAIVLGGSTARNIHPGDQYADLDFLLFVTDPDSDRYIEWMRNYAPLWMIVREHNAPTRLWLVLYQGGHKVDLSVNDHAALQKIVDTQQLWSDQERGYLFLLDKDGVAVQMPAPVDHPPYKSPSAETFKRCIDQYFYGTVYVAKHIKRDRLWTVKWADCIQQRFMLEMLEWHAHATHEAPIDTWHRGGFMQEWVSDETWQALHHIFAHFDAADSWQALLASMTLFRRLAQETAERLAYPYPAQMIREVTAYVEALYEQG